MFYWVFCMIITCASFITYSFFRNQIARKALLARIKEKWGQPNDDTRNMDLISVYSLFDKSNERISPATANDLDLDNVFAYIDRTNSKPGQQYLYNRLHHPQFNKEILDRLDKNITALHIDRSNQERIELELSKPTKKKPTISLSFL